MNKEKIIQRLYDKGHITFEEVMVLQRDAGALPQTNMLFTHNNYQVKPNPPQGEEKPNHD